MTYGAGRLCPGTGREGVDVLFQALAVVGVVLPLAAHVASGQQRATQQEERDTLFVEHSTLDVVKVTPRSGNVHRLLTEKSDN